ncbi:MAG: FtsX-like permease family protein [Alphaproteobacteria bacterium]|nr:FtsX-like permease family protein [Alphaproteobacteria bacterium]
MENITEMNENPARRPRPEEEKLRALRCQRPPLDSKEELPLSEGYSKTFLSVIVAVSVFLFAITLSGVLGINSMFENSKKQVISNFTVQVLPLPNHEDSKKDLLAVVSFLERYPNITEVSVLSDLEIRSLLEPWLGNNVDIELLPIPKLLDVKIDTNVEFDYKKLAVRLSEISSQASINDHNLWLSRLLKFINSLKVLAMTVLLLVALASITAIVYAAQTSLNVHKDIISILHIMGATDKYIALNYVKQITYTSIIAGITGTVIATPAIIIVGSLAKSIEAGIFNSVTFGPEEWLIIFILPMLTAILVASTAYITIVKSLRSMV